MKQRREITLWPRGGSRGRREVRGGQGRVGEGHGKKGDIWRNKRLYPPTRPPKMTPHPLPPSSAPRPRHPPSPAVSCRSTESTDAAGGSPPRNLQKVREGEGRRFGIDSVRGGGMGVMLLRQWQYNPPPYHTPPPPLRTTLALRPCKTDSTGGATGTVHLVAFMHQLPRLHRCCEATE